MASTRKSSTNLTQAAREGNARRGYCASAFFASAADIPAFVSEFLPDDEFCTSDDMIKAVRRLEVQLLQLNPAPGKHLVLLNVKEARSLILTLVLADSSIGLSTELDPTPAIAAQQAVLKKTVQAVKKVIDSAQSGTISYEQFRDELDKLPNPALTESVLSLIGQRVPTVQSLAGPVDLNVGKLSVKEVASTRSHELIGRVAGGYDEQAGTVVLEVTSLGDADPRLFSPGVRLKAQVVQEEHRMSLLLAQLAKVPVKFLVNIPRVPLTVLSISKLNLNCDLLSIELLEKAARLETIREELLRQLPLEL